MFEVGEGGLPVRRVGLVAAGALVGAALGGLAFGLSRVHGWVAFVVVGGLVGGVAVGWWSWLRGVARLSTVKVMVPRISEWTFTVDDAARATAWSLFLETVTRVSTQSLGEEGRARESLTSLHGLFGTTREVLRAARPSTRVAAEQSVEHLAVMMLNRELRPFLSRWHSRLSEHERAHPGEAETAWPDREAFVTELVQVQQNLVTYAHGYARLAGVHDADALLGHQP